MENINLTKQQVATDTKPPIQPMVSAPKMKTNVLVITLVVLLFLSTLTTIYFFNLTQQLTKQQVKDRVQSTTTFATTPKPTITQTNVVYTANWKTYEDRNKKFSFKYPDNLSYLSLQNDVFSFFKSKEDLDGCRKNLLTKDPQNQSCFKAKFNFNGFSKYSQAEYNGYMEEEKKSGNPVNHKTYTDSQGRLWQTDIVLGEGYNFSATYNTNNIYYVVSFQAEGFTQSEEEARTFFEIILSTIEFK